MSVIPLHPGSGPQDAAQEELDREIAARFGLVPNFFRSAPQAPYLMRELWEFAQSAYLDTPIPTLFKERLFVYLSRFCEVRHPGETAAPSRWWRVPLLRVPDERTMQEFPLVAIISFERG